MNIKPPNPRLLVVDDDEVYRLGLGRAFSRRGYQVACAGSVAEGRTFALAASFDYATVDLRMPGGSGLILVEELARLHPAIVIVVLTGYGSIATAVQAVKLGASHYLPKPADVNDLEATFERGHSLHLDQAIDHEVPSLARAEWEHINRVLADCGGNISRAARLLRIERKSLQRKLAKYPVPK